MGRRRQTFYTVLYSACGDAGEVGGPRQPGGRCASERARAREGGSEVKSGRAGLRCVCRWGMARFGSGAQGLATDGVVERVKEGKRSRAGQGRAAPGGWAGATGTGTRLDCNRQCNTTATMSREEDAGRTLRSALRLEVTKYSQHFAASTAREDWQWQWQWQRHWHWRRRRRRRRQRQRRAWWRSVAGDGDESQPWHANTCISMRRRRAFGGQPVEFDQLGSRVDVDVGAEVDVGVGVDVDAKGACESNNSTLKTQVLSLRLWEAAEGRGLVWSIGRPGPSAPSRDLSPS